MTKYIYEDGLETERLIARKLVFEDYKPWTAFYADPEAVEYFPDFGSVSDEEKARQWVERQLKRYEEQRYGLQALFDKKTGAFIGQCGLLTQEVDGITELEVGYHVFRKFWGQGYATEAAKRFKEYGFANNLAESIISIIDIRNTRSQNVAVKNGMTREKQSTWWGLNVYIYRVEKKQKASHLNLHPGIADSPPGPLS